MKFIKYIFVSFVVLATIASCARERPSTRPPIHPILDMDFQNKYDYQEESEFFADGATMRVPDPGTVPRGFLRTDRVFFEGRNDQEQFVAKSPVNITTQSLNRGQEKYDIYCSPCHSRVGDGKGIMIERGYVPPPTFHSDRLRDIADGHIFDVITHGIRNMPGYRYQIPPVDRWHIVNYMRALQRSQNASLEDIPVEIRDRVK